MQYRLVRDDTAAPALLPPDHAYVIRDERDNILGVVASSMTPSGKQWVAARVMPTRSRPWSKAVWGPTRKAAVDALLRELPSRLTR